MTAPSAETLTVDQVPLTEALVDFALGSTAVPDAAVAATQRVLLDTIGCTAAALATDAGRRLAASKLRMGGRADATLIGHETRLPSPSVAYVHGHAANYLDLEETLHHKAHVAACGVMPALAVAEEVGATGSDLLTAAAIGYDLAARATLAFPLYDLSVEGDVRLRAVGFSAAVLGTAASAARLYGLTPEQTAHALGIAYLSAPIRKPRFTTDMGMTKYTFYAPVAEAGVTAARLAQEGFTSDDGILEPQREFWTAFGTDEYDLDVLLGGLGERWYVEDAALKPYPTCRQGHVALDCLRAALGEGGWRPHEVERIVLRIPPSQMVRLLTQLEEPTNEVQAQFSLPYAMALLVLGIPVERWQDADVIDGTAVAWRDVSRRIEVVELPAWFDRMVAEIRQHGTYFVIPSEVEVHGAGRQAVVRREQASGDPWSDATAFDADAAANKFHRFATGLLGADRARAAVQAVERLPEARDLVELTAAIA